MNLQSFDIPTPQGISSSDVDPIVLYLTSDIETRAEIITTHPDVAGFIFLDEGHLTKVYFPTRIRSWTSSPPKHTIAAVMGNPSSYTPSPSLRKPSSVITRTLWRLPNYTPQFPPSPSANF